MFNLEKYQNKNIAIYGLGITGISVAKTLKKLNSKIETMFLSTRN